MFFYVNNIIAAYCIKDLLKLYLFKEELRKKYEIKNLGGLT